MSGRSVEPRTADGIRRRSRRKPRPRAASVESAGGDGPAWGLGPSLSGLNSATNKRWRGVKDGAAASWHFFLGPTRKVRRELTGREQASHDSAGGRTPDARSALGGRCGPRARPLAPLPRPTGLHAPARGNAAWAWCWPLRPGHSAPSRTRAQGWAAVGRQALRRLCEAAVHQNSLAAA